MRRSPRPDGTGGRAAHPDRAILAASFAEDVVLDLADDEDEGGATKAQTQTSVAADVEESPKAAPRTNPPPVAKPRSGMGRKGDGGGLIVLT